MTDCDHPMEKPTVLVVEDNAVNMMVLRLMLERAGHTPIEATDGVEAVAVALAQRPDIILMDLMMPRMDGIAAAREILSRAGDRPPKIIAVTGNTVEQVRRECMEVGFDSVVVKPVRIDELTATIDRLISASAGP